MKIKRVGCVARRVSEKLNESLADLNVTELATLIYMNPNGHHRRDIRRTLLTMELPEGWSLILGENMRAVRYQRPKLRYFNHGRLKNP